jgi:hypothetical protein
VTNLDRTSFLALLLKHPQLLQSDNSIVGQMMHTYVGYGASPASNWLVFPRDLLAFAGLQVHRERLEAIVAQDVLSLVPGLLQEDDLFPLWAVRLVAECLHWLPDLATEALQRSASTRNGHFPPFSSLLLDKLLHVPGDVEHMTAVGHQFCKAII